MTAHTAFLDRYSQPVEWHAEAACNQEDWAHALADLFNPDTTYHHTAVARWCGHCPVVAECLNYALVAREHLGCWGGRTEKELDRMDRRIHRPSRVGGNHLYGVS